MCLRLYSHLKDTAVCFLSRFNSLKHCLDFILTIKTGASYLFISAKSPKMDFWMCRKLLDLYPSTLLAVILSRNLLFAFRYCLRGFANNTRMHRNAKCVSSQQAPVKAWRVRSGLVGHSRYMHSINPSLNMALSQQVLANELLGYKVILLSVKQPGKTGEEKLSAGYSKYLSFPF